MEPLPHDALHDYLFDNDVTCVAPSCQLVLGHDHEAEVACPESRLVSRAGRRYKRKGQKIKVPNTVTVGESISNVPATPPHTYIHNSTPHGQSANRVVFP
jgi:hypothetical protein